MPSVFLPLVPNWKSSVTDTFEFLTDIFTSEDGTEQRRSNRMIPRRSLSMSMVLDGDRRRVFADTMNRMRTNTGELTDFTAEPAFIIGDDPRKIYSMSHIPSWLTVGTRVAIVTGRWAMQGTVATLGDYAFDMDAYSEAFGGTVDVTFGPIETIGDYEFDIDAYSEAYGGRRAVHVVSESITLLDGVSFEASGFDQGFAGGFVNPDIVGGPGVRDGSYLLPIAAGNFAKSQTTTIMNNNVATTNVTFDVAAGSVGRTPDATPQVGSAALYKGRYVLLRRPNFLSSPTAAFVLPFEQIDYGRGVARSYADTSIMSRTLTGTYLGIGRDQVNAIRDVFLRARGRAGEILVPSWGLDLPPVVSVTGNTMKVYGTTFYDSYNGDKAHKTLLIHAKNGSAQPMTITAMSKTADSTIITFDAAVPFTKAAILGSSWLFVARFAQDSLTCDWITTEYANVVLSFTTLENLPAEQGFGADWSLDTGYFTSGTWSASNLWPESIMT